MKILHLSSEKTWRGGEQQIAYLIEELQAAGIRNFVLVRQDSAFHAYCEQQGLPFLAVPFAKQFDFKTALKLKQYCREQNIDLVHAHSSHSHAISIWAAVLGNRVPVILSRRVDFPVSQNLLSRFKYQHKIIRKVICVSEKVREIVIPALRSPELAVTVYDGIDLNRFATSRNTGKLHAEFNLPPDLPLIGNVSALADQKDYFTFVNTAEHLLHQGLKAHFFIIGDGPMRGEIEDFVKQKELAAHITFTGFRNDVPDIMPELDAFLITSKTEGLGTTILDAFACRVPVVATKGGGIPEIVKEGKTGLLAEVADYKQLALNVNRILEDKALAGFLSGNAYQLLQDFRKENTARRTLEIYRSVLAEEASHKRI